MSKKIVYLLIGPKGSGKTFLGTLMDKEMGIKFIRVEDWAKEVKRERQINDLFYLNEVFQTIEKGVRSALDQHDQVVFESTGLTDNFDRMLERLRQDFTVITIGVHANKSLCLERVKTRDQSIHINVSDHQVNSINQQVSQKGIKTDLAIFNEYKSADEVVREIQELINTHSH